MQTGRTTVAEDLRDSAIWVARNVPTAHWLSRRLREWLFKRLADRFVENVYSVDVSGYAIDDFDQLEEAINIATKSIELYLLARDQGDHGVPRHYFALIEKLRSAREGVIRGYAPNPARRPSSNEIETRAEAKLHALFVNTR